MTLTQSHDAAIIEQLRQNARFAREYLSQAFSNIDKKCGQSTFLIALSHMVEAKGGCPCISLQTNLSIEELTHILGPDGNPTLKTLLGIVAAVGFQLSELAIRDVPFSDVPSAY